MDIQLRRGFHLRHGFGGQVDGQGSPHAAGLVKFYHVAGCTKALYPLTRTQLTWRNFAPFRRNGQMLNSKVGVQVRVRANLTRTCRASEVGRGLTHFRAPQNVGQNITKALSSGSASSSTKLVPPNEKRQRQSLTPANDSNKFTRSKMWAFETGGRRQRVLFLGHVPA